ncbi:unnamed protein product, partial [Mesorhabditis belari]|uniref:N-acetyltransferase domain-containing protein n=1 Tax=Mesorhabditis belari TaxID=2138241 RepID=A0AAF3FMI4_9BILA
MSPDLLDIYDIRSSATDEQWADFVNMIANEEWKSNDVSTTLLLQHLPSTRIVIAVRKDDDTLVSGVAWNEVDNVAMIGFYLTKEKERHKGIGSLVWRQAMECIDRERRIVVVRTGSEMAPKYQKSDLPICGKKWYRFVVKAPQLIDGFSRILDKNGVRNDKNNNPGLSTKCVNELSIPEFDSLLDYDQKVTSKDRSDFLDSFFSLDCVRACVTQDAGSDGEVNGFGAIVPSVKEESHRYRLAPIYAGDLNVAISIALSLIKRVYKRDADAEIVIQTVDGSAGSMQLHKVLHDFVGVDPMEDSVALSSRKLPLTTRLHMCYIPHNNGGHFDILSSILDGLGLQSRYLVGNVKYPVNTSNPWPGATGYLYNDTADVIGVFYQRTPPREAAFSFSYPLTYVQPLFATKAIRRKKTGGLYDNFSPFEWSVWGCLLASLLSLTLVFSLIVKLEWIMKKREIDMGIFQIFWGTVSTQLGEADEFFLFPSISGHMLFAFLTVFLSGVVMWAYEGYVIYSLLKPAALFPFTQEEMFKYLATKKYTLIVPSAQHWLTEFINNSDSEFYRKLRTSLKNNPWIEGKSHDVLTLLATGNHIYFSQEDDEMMIEVQQLCGITTNSMGLGQASAHFILQKKSRFLTSFNTEIIRQQSFIHRTQTKYFESGFKLTKKVKRCPPIDPLAEETLGLSDMLGVFYLVAIGLAAAVLAFFVEFVVFRYYNPKLWALWKFKKKLSAAY